MKTLWALVAILFTFTFVMEEAHAKRMGGGKSFGRSYQTAPAPSRNNADAPAQRQQADAAKPAQQGTKKGGLMGGLGLEATLEAFGALGLAEPRNTVNSSSLLLMIGLALRLGAGRAAPFLVLVLAASASVRSLLDALPFASVLKEAIKRRKPDFSEGRYGFRTFGNLLEEAQARLKGAQ